MKKGLKYLELFLLLVTIKLIITFSYNEIIIHNYKNGNYHNNLYQILYFLNFYEPYIAYYNHGNILFQNNQYEEATKKYYQALQKNPPQTKICDIRINLSLAMIYQIDTTNDSKDVLEQLELAKNNLYENHCASPTNEEGRSQDAENLEEEIQQLEEQIQYSSSNNNTPTKEEGNSSEKEDTDIEGKLKDNEKEANANRQSDLNSYENLGDFEYYSGKRW